jgi:CheY-like chemotaxis protein
VQPRERRGRVLVVDDNRDAAELVAEALTLSGFATCVAFDGPSALAAAPNFAPDVALLDLGLPVMDGFALARRLRELDGLAGLRLVAVTGYGQPSDRDRSRQAGFDEHLVKPVELDRVEGVVARLIGSER